MTKRHFKLVFDHRMLQHINEASEKETGRSSGVLRTAERLLQVQVIAFTLWLLESCASFMLSLPIPIYRSLVHTWVTNSRGLPHMAGMYLRALYYRRIIGNIESNVFIDQNVFFAYPKNVTLREFAFIDKGVIIMSRTTSVGRRVHIAPRVFISGGGHFSIDDYACIAANSTIVTSTEILRDGARCSGPMVSADQRNVIRGTVTIEKDAFIGVNVTILPNVTVRQGSVAGAGVTLSRSTEPWGIYVGSKAEKVSDRAPVKWPDN